MLPLGEHRIVANLLERFPQARQLIGRNSDAFIAYGKCHAAADQARFDPYLSAGQAEFKSVGQKIEQDLLDSALVGEEIRNSRRGVH